MDKKVKFNYILIAIASLELIAAGLFTLAISSDTKNNWLFGFSKQRWGLMLFACLLAVLIFIVGNIANHKRTNLMGLLHISANSLGYRLFAAAAFFLVLWGWCSIFCPAYLFGDWAAYYERLRPLSIAVGLILLQFYLFHFFYDKKSSFHPLALFTRQNPFFRASIFFTVCVIALAAFMAITKIGLVKDTAFWNVPGIPLTGLQFLAVIVVIGLGMYLLPQREQLVSSTGSSRFIQFLPFLIYLGAVLIWGLTPMTSHFFSLQPTPPNYQPYPYSDARVDDLGGISIIKGDGIYFHGYIDKPLYLVLLSFLHLFAGYNYSLLTWMQILVLSLIPVVLYLFGKKFYSRGFGLFLSVITILRQRNAIVLSSKIASVNPKLLVTEVMTLLAIALLAYLVFLWLRTQKLWLALLSGGVIGAASLIRMNPFFLFPVIACLVLVALWKFPKLRWKHLLLYTLGFLIMVTPWFITGVNQDGKPWIWVKIAYVFNIRYESVIEPTVTPTGLPLTQATPLNTPVESVLSANTPMALQGSTQQPTLDVSPQPTPTLNVQPESTFKKITQFSDLFINHFLHNFATSAMALPDSLIYDDLNHLSLRPYWIDGNNWQGSLPAIQIIFIILNLILFAIGLGYSWSRYHWAGLVPLFIFLGYDLSLASAMSSGSRYIVPIDWILYFYYGLAIVYILRWVKNSLHGREQRFNVAAETALSTDTFNKKRLWQSLGILIMAASLIPVANDVVPAILNHPAQSAGLKELENSIPASLRNGTTLFSGTVLYPYYEKDLTFDFDLLVGQNVTSYSIKLNKQPLKITLWGNETILVGLRTQNAGKEIKFIYLEKGSSLVLIWESNSLN